MTFAIVGDVAVDLGRPFTSTAESDQAQAWLDRVERTIERGFRRAGLDLQQQVAIGDPTSGEVADIEIAAVVRKIQNPTWGESSYTTSLDDGSITRRREGASADSDPLSLLDSEWDTLLPARRRGGRVFSVMPS